VTVRTLSRYLDGDLPPEAGREVEEHVAQCAACNQTLREMKAMEEVVRQPSAVPDDVPDLAGRVTAELQHRGAFLRARVDGGRRQLFGESPASLKTGVALLAAASLLAAVLVGADYLTRDAWTRRTAPVVADAERVLVRLVRVDPAADEQARLAWARQEARKLSLSDRLAEARRGADAALSGDLAYLETTFAMLARDDPLPSTLQAELAAGGALEHVVRLREVLQPKS
jgi:anti-sigma factor RsiW